MPWEEGSAVAISHPAPRTHAVACRRDLSSATAWSRSRCQRARMKGSRPRSRGYSADPRSSTPAATGPRAMQSRETASLRLTGWRIARARQPHIPPTIRCGQGRLAARYLRTFLYISVHLSPSGVPSAWNETGALFQRKTGRFAAAFMELAGLEPATSWVRSSHLQEPERAWLSGFLPKAGSPQHLPQHSAARSPLRQHLCFRGGALHGKERNSHRDRHACGSQSGVARLAVRRYPAGRVLDDGAQLELADDTPWARTMFDQPSRLPFWGENGLRRHQSTRVRIEAVNERRHDGEERA
jgi:hypothetical protein